MQIMLLHPFIPAVQSSQASLFTEPDAEQQIGSQTWLLKRYAMPHVGAIYDGACQGAYGFPATQNAHYAWLDVGCPEQLWCVRLDIR